MDALIGAFRLLLVMLTIVVGAVVCGFAGVLGRGVFDKLAMRWNGIALRFLGIRTRYHGADLAIGALLLSNHISWLDTLVFGARWPVTFLANSEIARWPVLGWVIRKSGTLFIERGKGAKKAITEIGGALKRGRYVVLFPEGKTTDGRSVIRFQPRLVQAAIDAEAPLQPAAVRYFDAAGRRVVRHSFAGEAGLWQSAWRTVTGPRITAEVTLFAPLAPGEKRQALASRAERLVRELVESGGSGRP